MRTALGVTALLPGGGASPLAAQQGQTWHQADLRLDLGQRLDLTLHTQLRTGPAFANLRQGRTGPILRWQATPRFVLLGGYYWRQDEVDDGAAEVSHRLFGGAEATFRPRGATLVVRTLFEQFLVPGGEPFQRHRRRVRLTWERAVSPALSSELYLDRHGWLASRNIMGVRWRIPAGWTLETGYMLDMRRADAGGTRHVWQTTVEYRVRPRRP